MAGNDVILFPLSPLWKSIKVRETGQNQVYFIFCVFFMTSWLEEVILNAQGLFGT